MQLAPQVALELAIGRQPGRPRQPRCFCQGAGLARLAGLGQAGLGLGQGGPEGKGEGEMCEARSFLTGREHQVLRCSLHPQVTCRTLGSSHAQCPFELLLWPAEAG